MEDIKVIDNFLIDSEFNYLKNVVYRNYEFPWRYTGVCNTEWHTVNDVCDDKFNFQFAHVLYNQNVPQSDFFYLLNPFFNQLKIRSLIQAKFNFTPVTNKIIEHCFHIDVVDESYDSTTAVYYLNTCDGYTLFETGEKVESIENRIVLFPATKKHTGTTCTNVQGRYVLNINYF